jgi:hypothetical protein
MEGTIMTSLTPDLSLSRRSAIAGLGAGGVGLALSSTLRQVSAQDASPAAMAGHPLVGTWIITRDITNTTEVPVVVVFTADGGFIDPNQGVAGAWEPTGPRSAAMTIIPFPGGGAEGYAVVRATWEIDEGGNTMSGPAAITIVAPDGSVIATPPSTNSSAIRLHVESMENQGKPLAGFPAWHPATPEAGTPTS